MLMEAAAWAAIVTVPIGLIGVGAPFVVTVSGKQRELRQQLREVLFPIVKACNEHQNGNEDAFSQQFIHDSRERLLILSKRDGLKCPNPAIVGMLDDALAEVASRSDLARHFPSFGISPEERARLMENNEQWIKAEALRAGAQAAVLIEAMNEVDHFNYRVYRKLEWHGSGLDELPVAEHSSGIPRVIVPALAVREEARDRSGSPPNP